MNYGLPICNEGFLSLNLIVQGLFYKFKDEEVNAKDVLPAPEELSMLTVQDEGKLNSYGWVDQKKGVVYIPIDNAMRIEARELETEREKASALESGEQGR